MYETGLALVEILLVVLGLYLLHWWTNKEASETNSKLHSQMALSESSYMQLMVDAAKTSASLQPNMLRRQV